MAAHLTGTFAYQTESLTATGSARGIDGPVGGGALQMYVTTAAATVHVQTGTGITDGTTDISTDGGLVPTETWVEISALPEEAPTYANKADSGTVFVQTDTNPTVITYRFTRGDA